MVITGDGSASTVIRRANATVTGGAQPNRMLAVSNARGQTLHVAMHGFTIDHNEQGNPFGVGESGFAWEQASAIRLAPIGVRGITFEGGDLRGLNPVADFLNFAGGGANSFGSISLFDVAVPTRNRRRFDVTITASFDTFTLRNSDITSLRFEQNGTNYDQHHDVLVEDVVVEYEGRILDGTGSSNFVVVVGDDADAYNLFRRKPVHVVRRARVNGAVTVGGGDLVMEDSTFDLRHSMRFLGGAHRLTRCGIDAYRTDHDYGTGVFYTAGDYVPESVTLTDCAIVSAAPSTARLFRFVEPKVPAVGGLVLDGCTITSNNTLWMRGGQHRFIDTTFAGAPPDGKYIRFESPRAEGATLLLDGVTFENDARPVEAPVDVTVTTVRRTAVPSP